MVASVKKSAVIERASLLRALRQVGSSVYRKSLIPILTHMLIRAEKGALILTATDMDLRATATVTAETAGKWSITLPWEPVMGLVSSLPEGAQIELAEEGSRVIVRSGRTSARFAMLPVEEFPGEPEMQGQPMSLELDAEAFRQLINEPLPFISHDVSSGPFSGVHLHNGEGHRLWAAAYNRRALLAVSMDLPEGAAHFPATTLHPAGIAAITSILKDIEGPVVIEIGNNLIRLSVDSIAFTSKLLDSKFFDYHRAIPAERPFHITFEREAVMAALSRLLPLAEADSMSCRTVIIEAADGAAKLSSADRHRGTDADETLDCEAEPAVMRLALNGVNLKQLLGSMDAEAVQFSAADLMSNVIISGVGVPETSVRATSAVRA